MRKYSRLIAVGIATIVFFGIMFVVVVNRNGVVVLDDYEFEIASARLASAKNALDGSGELTKIQCEYLGKLAREFDRSADFLDCSSPSSLYLATPDTADNKVLTLSDDNYTAKFTVDNEFKTLVIYEFINEPSAGFNTFGGRK